MVFDKGTVDARLARTNSVDRSVDSPKASNSPAMIASSISAPLNPSLARARAAKSNFAGSRFRFLIWMRNI